MLWLPGIALLLFVRREQIRFPQPLRLELISATNAVAARHAAQVHIGTMLAHRGRKRGRKPKICDIATAKRIRSALICARDGDQLRTKYGKDGGTYEGPYIKPMASRPPQVPQPQLSARKNLHHAEIRKRFLRSLLDKKKKIFT